MGQELPPVLSSKGYSLVRVVDQNPRTTLVLAKRSLQDDECAHVCIKCIAWPSCPSARQKVWAEVVAMRMACAPPPPSSSTSSLAAASTSSPLSSSSVHAPAAATPPPPRPFSPLDAAAAASSSLFASLTSPSLTPPSPHTSTNEGSSPYVVPLLDAMQDDGFLYLVMPYLRGGDLCECLMSNERGGLPEDEARRYFIHVAQGLLHLKRHGIAHGDVSTENVMLSCRRAYTDTPPHTHTHTQTTHTQLPCAQLIDLGSACFVPGPNCTCPACEYRFGGKSTCAPPEVLNGVPVLPHIDVFAIDVWSLGVALFSMLTGRQLYTSQADPAFRYLTEGRAADLLDCYQSLYGVRKIPDGANDLICAMLRPDPAQRATLEQVMEHAWVRESASMSPSPPSSSSALTSSSSSSAVMCGACGTLL